MTQHKKSFLEKLSWAYTTTALLAINCFVIFLCINLIALFVLDIYADKSSAVEKRYSFETVKTAYPGWDSTALKELLHETWSRPLHYEPFTHLKESPVRGVYVNVDEAGFRRSSGDAPWPPTPGNLNIFIFGGSTTFGYGVADYETIPSSIYKSLNQKKRALPIAVYNFGRGYYVAMQESILLQRIIRDGVQPDIAIFIDGLNEFYYANDEAAPPVTRHHSSPLQIVLDVEHFPAVAFFHTLRSKPQREVVDARLSEAEQNSLIRTTVDRYAQVKRVTTALSNARNIQTLYVLQPIPTYDFDIQQHPFAHDGFGRHALSGEGYAILTAEFDKEREQNTLNLSMIHHEVQGPAYVDLVHYTAGFNKIIGEKIASTVEESLLEKAFIHKRSTITQ